MGALLGEPEFISLARFDPPPAVYVAALVTAGANYGIGTVGFLAEAWFAPPHGVPAVVVPFVGVTVGGNYGVGLIGALADDWFDPEDPNETLAAGAVDYRLGLAELV
ncbi:MAG: hypothetical protein AAF676_06575 [Pseudomonadota bacterium]